MILKRITRQSHKRRGTGQEGKGTIFRLDVHAETIAVAVAESHGEVCSLGTIPNRAEPIRKTIKKLGAVEQLRACYRPDQRGTFSAGNWRSWESSAK
ncbi:MAG: hypothetical protein ACYCPD_14935 [Acidobacteriaceae bacterium]